MPAVRPTADARVQLDEYIQSLVRLGNGLTLDDFRSQTLQEAKRMTRRIRAGITGASLFFLVLTFGVLVAQVSPETNRPEIKTISVAAWCLAVGGLGAVANIFLHVMKLAPQPTVVIADEFELYGRIVLGCLFSTILSIALFKDLREFFDMLHGSAVVTDPKTGIVALAPFLFGYSIPLVMRVLEKIIQAIEITLGAEEHRVPNAQARTTRRSTRRKL